MSRTVVVVGGGIAGLVAARAAALTGDDVLLVEAASRWGGSVAGEPLGDVIVDVGPESFASRGTAVGDLARAVGLEPAEPAQGGAWLELGGRAAPLPAGVLGIPAHPLSDDVRAVIGGRAAARAWLDRIIPELHIGRHHDLGALVRKRMGATVLDTLVRPVVEGVYGIDPDHADVDALLPGLNGALTRNGSLSAAVESLRRAAPAGASVTGIRGGMHRLVDALVADLEMLGAQLSADTPVLALDRAERWGVLTAAGRTDADRVVLATPGPAARGLLAPHLRVDDEWPRARESVALLLRVVAPELDPAPRGTGLLVAHRRPGGPSALTHSSAKWPWLADLLPPGEHVLRLSYPGNRIPAPEDALRDAGGLLGQRLDPRGLVAVSARRWTQDPSRAEQGYQDRLARMRDALAGLPGLGVTGAWQSGSGLAAVVPHAQAVGARTS